MDPVVPPIVDIALALLIEFYAYISFYNHFTACIFYEMYLVRNDENKDFQ